MHMLRYLTWGCFLLLATLPATGQLIKIETSDRGPNEGVWRFRAGDSTGWANPAYDDRQWVTMDPDTDLDNNPTLYRAGRGWFRQTFRFQRLRGKDVTITMQQFGRSEVFLDGRLLSVLTPARYDSGGSQRMVALLPIRIADSNRHVLAVRYAFRRDPVLSATVNQNPFELSFGLTNQSGLGLLDDRLVDDAMNYLLIGVFAALSLLHFLFYRANPTQAVNRVLGWTMLAFAVLSMLVQAEDLTGNLTLDSLVGGTAKVAISAAFGLLLLSVYTYLGRRAGPLFWLIMALLTANALYGVSIGAVPDNLVWVPYVLVLVEYVRVSWLAKRRNPNPDARLPWNSLKVTFFSILTLFLVGILAGILSSVSQARVDPDWILVPVLLLTLITVLSIPLGLSLSLVRDYARTYRSLGQKLTEVEQLSAQTLVQEQEKQQLLARQNELLEEQVASRTAELNQSLTDLRATQAQLVQREKLASLGELTAGIAHEIQNPLNFVNNFAEVSVELVEELREERQKMDNGRDEELEAELLNDLGQNARKISEHGKRAANIVRGMLEHSRVSTGQKQPTDLNALCAEYLRLSYHGLQAKDKTFCATCTTDFAPDLPHVGAVSEDLGRVLLNLFNNAFYAVRQRQQAEGDSYQPTVSVSTCHLTRPLADEKTAASTVEIRIRDNGLGIPSAVRSKIFQPFFTTKPTGQGTGLGLSISYDIITKAHGGTLTVRTEPETFTEFVITLPV